MKGLYSKQIDINLFAAVIPKEATEACVNNNILWYNVEDKSFLGSIMLSEDFTKFYEIIGSITSKDRYTFDCEPYVQKKFKDKYLDYNSGEYLNHKNLRLFDKNSSFITKLQSAGVDTDVCFTKGHRILIIKEI